MSGGEFPFMAAATMGAAALGSLGAHSANRANRDAAREQMAFQEKMSSTAYQRAVADMRAAGINPMLAARLGGASSPGGASSHSENEMGGLPQSVATAMAVRRQGAEMELLKRQAEQQSASAENLKAQTRNVDAQNMKEKLWVPVYNAAGDIIDWAVGGVKKGLVTPLQRHLEDVGNIAKKEVFTQPSSKEQKRMRHRQELGEF